VTDPAQADVIRTVQGDAVPSQGAISAEELLEARAGRGPGWSLSPSFLRRVRGARECAHDSQGQD